ncbi:hypothetical protein [Deinococcus maricopensis]|uniref:Uncharacterized protein n=1 Tax=Deinococcus maricopensis (strain DSM 21211 / LMG 22137 / NRRL B-23946 / LB-34) TaxID=709986 RepID=E8U8I8_DEIML|nr:hypothetical protein [Deinococcus maricopensis]ADV67377.1 conserved hypothetical protein, precursor [Deinococcus maricopensis DSM 21211]
MRRAVLAAVAVTLLSSAARPPTVMNAALSPTTGGVLLEASVSVMSADTLLGVWGPVGRGKLMRCAPRCVVVQSVAMQRGAVLSRQGLYRVVLAGRYTRGQRVAVLLKFGSGLVRVDALVGAS